MAQVIDSLLVSLGLDTTEYVQGQKKASDSFDKFEQKTTESTKKVGAQSKAMAEGFNKVKNELIGLVAVMLGTQGIKDFIVSTTKSNMELGSLAKNLGMSVRDLDAWDHAVTKVGGTADGFNASLQSIQGGLTEFSMTGQANGVVTALNALKIPAVDAQTGKLREMKDILTDLSNAFGPNSKLPQQVQMYGAKQLGFDPGTLRFLQQGPDLIKQQFDAMARLSGVTEQTVDGARKLTSAWADFRAEIDGLGNLIYANLTGPLEAALKGLTEFIDKLRFGKLLPDKKDIKGSKDPSRSVAGEWLEEHFHDVWNGIKREKATPSGNAISRRQGVQGSVMGGTGGITGTDSMSTADFFASIEQHYGLPAGTLSLIWQIESSSGKNKGRSAKGALGDFQFMESTGKDYGLNTDADRMDLKKSAEAAGHYLGDLYKQFGDIRKAVAAYNEGPGNLQKYGISNNETRGYVNKFDAAGGTTIKSETHIGQVNIVTQATDATGIAKSIGPAIEAQSKRLAVVSGMQQ